MHAHLLPIPAAGNARPRAKDTLLRVPASLPAGPVDPAGQPARIDPTAQADPAGQPDRTGQAAQQYRAGKADRTGQAGPRSPNSPRSLSSAVSLLVLLLLTLLTPHLSGCASKDVEAPEAGEVLGQRDALRQHTAPRTFTETDGPFLGGRLVGRERDELDTPLMRARVTLKQRGSLARVAASVSTLAPVTVHVADDILPMAQSPSSPAKHGENSVPLPGLDDLLPDAGSLAAGPNVVDVDYTGTLRGLLDSLAAQSGYGWDYDPKSNRVTFSAMQVRTYALSASVGQVVWDSQVSNKSRERRGSDLSGGNINATVESGDTSTQTAQVNTTRAVLDVWKDVEAAVKGMLSKAGTVTVNQSSGTLTVRDTWTRLEAVSRYVDGLNARLERQVALSVRVWALEVNDENEAGLDLRALFTSPDVAVAAGTATGATGRLATVSVLRGSLEGSSAVLRAMREKGDATQLTSAAGLVMNMQPFPVQAVRRHAYLAGMTMSTSEYSQTSEITPGEVTTGFAMTLVPHILPDRHVVLQYTVTLSSLDDMTTIERDGVAVQLPQVSTRAFSQRTRLKSGQTLVLAGFEQDTAQAARDFGILGGGGSSSSARTLLVVTIELEGADNV